MSARDDCGFGLAGTSLTVPILANDDDPGVPAALQVALPDAAAAGRLWLSNDGLLHYDGGGDAAHLSLRYRALEADPADPGGEVFLVFQQGEEPPVLDDRAAAACSQTEPHRTIGAAPEAPVAGSCGSGIEVAATISGYRLKVEVDRLEGHSLHLEDESFATPYARYVEVPGGVLVLQHTGGVVFLAGADRTELDVTYGHPGDWGPACSSPREFIDFFVQAPVAGAAEALDRPEITRLVHLAPPAGASVYPAADEQSAPFCADQQACTVLRPQDSPDAVITDADPALEVREAAWPGHPLLQLAALAPATGEPSAALADALLAEAPDARAVVVRGFFEDDDVRLSIGGSYFVPAAELMSFARDVEVGGLPAQLIPPEAFPPRAPGTGPATHGGGAGFSPYGAGGLEGNLVPLLEQTPTEPGPGPSAPVRPPQPPVGGNREPVANDDLAATFNDQPILLHPLVNDFDPDPGDVIALVGVRGLVEAPPAAAGRIALAEASDGGSVRLLDAQTIRYVPDPTFEGIATIRYVIADDRGGVSAPATISVAVVERGANQPPVAVADTARTALDTPVVLDVLANDFDPDQTPGELLPGINLTLSEIVEPPEHGTLARLGGADGTLLRYTPEAGFSGLDRFAYQVSDGLSVSAPGEVTIGVGPGAELMAVDDAALAQVGGPPVAIAVLANDRGAQPSLVAVGAAARGEAVIDGDSVLYRPPASLDAAGPGRIVDRFSYTIADPLGQGDRALVLVDLNRAPEAVDDQVPIAGRRLTIDVLGNDRDLDGDALRITAVGPPAQPGATVEIGADGREILYTRGPGAAGEAYRDAFDYIVGDGRGGVADATVRLFEGPDAPPVLVVRPEQAQLALAERFDFPTSTPFPALANGQTLAPELVQEVEPGDLIPDVSRTVSLRFVSEDAGFANSLGVYTLVDGVPTAPEVVFARVEEGVVAESPILLGRFAAGVELGLFLVQNGADQLEGAGALAFRPAGDGQFGLVRLDGGEAQPIDAPVFFSDSTLNGGAVQAVAGRVDGGGALRIGFEDRPVGAGGTDADYDDTVFEVRYGLVADDDLELSATIDDPDSTSLSRATVTLEGGAAGDRLLFAGAAPAGIEVIADGPAALRFDGAGSAAAYEELLEAVTLEVDAFDGPRELLFQVWDDTGQEGLPSDVARVAVQPVPAEGGSLLASLVPVDQAAV